MFEKIRASKALEPFIAACSAGDTLLIEELWDASKALLASLAQEVTGKRVVIVTGGVREGRLFDDLPFFTSRSVAEFPAWETLPHDDVSPSPDIVGSRYEVLRALLGGGGPSLLLCPLQACLQRVLPPQALGKKFYTLRVGEELPLPSFAKRLEELSFERRSLVSDKGEYAVRGGIVDLFPVSSPDPVRIEFFGETIESIRLFDPVSQISTGKVQEVILTPAKEQEALLAAKEVASLFDYLGPNTIVIFDDLLSLEDRYVALSGLPGAISRSFVSFSDLLKEIGSLQKIFWTKEPIEELSDVRLLEPARYYSGRTPPHRISFSIFGEDLEASRWHHPFKSVGETFGAEGGELVPELAHALCEGRNLSFVAANDSEREHLILALNEAGAGLCEKNFITGYLSSGLTLDEEGLFIIPQSEITHRYRVRRQKQRSVHHAVAKDFQELRSGDIVVHLENGIGRYLGVERKLNHQGVETDFMGIEYAEKGKLYVPLIQAHLVSRYIGGKEETPHLHTLGSGRWARAREVTEQAIERYAADLLRLHAEREIAGGTLFPPDGSLMNRFEEEFPYVETDDQMLAIDAIKADMESPRAMDRLVCGDVGYGKTEVAMRAAFKAVESGKQVAVLVPTTVLAMQHFESFKGRMANTPARLALLTRFSSPKEVRAIRSLIAAGQIDILLGTHKIISSQLIWYDLGLVIIDEEQRFGVRVKEKLRAFRAGVDSLALSATPIPRTLYLSLMGARDLSVINTPPQDRLPIKTIVCPDEDETIKGALLRELARDGQAFVIHNRVETIDFYADKIRKLLPHAHVLTAHGQMDAEEIDEIFQAFKTGVADILVATTIVENGIDIPNANTIIVDRADRYGLADLYQLRGRVGRWVRRAYAYFLVQKNRALTEIANHRLSAIQEVGGYGGGMMIAMRDLEIRGAGNILGLEQSGHVSRIGFTLYCRLLKRTIDRLQGKGPATLIETKIDFPFAARLPEAYIPEPNLRMEIYHRLGEATDEASVDLIFDELCDRFGRPSKEVIWLYRLTRLRVFAARRNILSLKMKGFTLAIELQKGKKKLDRTLIIKGASDPERLEEEVRRAVEGFLRAV